MNRRRWSELEIVDRILALSKQGCDLTFARVRAEDSRLLAAAVRYFSGWREAVEAAGIDYRRIRLLGKAARAQKIGRWSKELIVAEIRRLHAAGEDLRWSIAESKYHRLCSAAVKKNYFGSWRAALAAAGLDYEQIRTSSLGLGASLRRWRKGLRELTASLPEAAEGTAGKTPGERRRLTISRRPTAGRSWARQLLEEKAREGAGGKGAPVTGSASGEA